IIRFYGMEQPTNLVVGNQPPFAVRVNPSFDNLTADELYEILTRGTDPFARTQRTRNQELLQFSTVILSGSSF
ncbi:9771_t:CDS:1, partial [Dentiscutata heterogama]